MDWYTVSVAVFILLLICILYKDRKNISRQSVLILRRTERGKGFLLQLGRRFPQFWKSLGTLGVCTGFFMSGYIVYYLFNLLIKNLTAKEAVQGLALVLPSPSQETVVLPGVMGIPFWYWIISISLLVIVHEGMHGLMAASERVRIKSLGWGLLAVIPLAFVEPDEKQLERKKPLSQLRVFAAGSFANFLLAGFTLLITILLSSYLFLPGGVAYKGLIEGYPAAEVNLTGVITKIDNYNITTVEDLRDALSVIGPNKTITIYTFVNANGSENYLNFTLTTAADPDNKSRGFIGIAGVIQFSKLKPEYKSYSEFINFLGGLLFYIFLINFGVGAANLMPIMPLDGGRMWKIVLKKYIPKKSDTIMKALSTATLLLVLLNFGTFLKGIF
ncbi:MAG: hypothetical protein DRP54_09070 [Spirochaetes bacterium]|nr:MAG: hypothetical protein DRP54_09070 [Spirochaetota bacterium]